MKGRSKYRKGPPITDWNTLLAQKCVYVPFGNEPIIKNMAFVQNLQLGLVAGMMERGQIFFALPIEGEKDGNEV